MGRRLDHGESRRLTRLSGPTGEIARQWLWRGLALPGVLWLLAFFLVPFYAIFAIAMGGLDPIFLSATPEWNPLEWDFGTFTSVVGDFFAGPLGTTALRTLIYVLVACAACLLVGYPVAYFVSRRAGRRKGLFLVALVAPFWINYLMRMLAWVNLLGRDGQVNSALGSLNLPTPDWLAGRPVTVVMGLVYGYIPFFILPLYAAIDRIDSNVIQAARDLGAGPRQAFTRVTLPLSRQGILAGLVLIMLPMFGDYYTPNLLSGSPRTRMIGNDIDQFVNGTVTAGAKGASTTIVLMAFVALLMGYYLVSVTRSTREAS